jgi:hypothetical protein
MLPVHLAAATDAPLDVILYLAVKWPASIDGAHRPRTDLDMPWPRKRPRPNRSNHGNYGTS